MLLRSSILSLFVVTLVVACGQSEHKPVVSSDLDSSNAEGIPCNKQNKCPTLTLTVNAQPMEGGQLRGFINQPGTWTFQGLAENGGARDIRIQGSNPPTVGQFKQINPLSITVAYRATLAVVNPQPLTISIRDVSLCQYLHPDKEAQCQNLLDKSSFNNLSQFQKDVAFQWNIVEPITAQEKAKTPLQDCTSGGVAGAIGGASGGVIGGIIGGVVGCVSGIFKG